MTLSKLMETGEINIAILYNDYQSQNRGSWGKCMNEQLFGALCIHDEMHAINNHQWIKGEGPLHDAFAESMFLRLKQLHNDYCLHVDVKFTPVMKEKLNDLYFARNEYSMVARNDTTSTFYFETLINPSGKYFINGNTLPVLQLLKGNTYYFVLRAEDYAKYPLTFGPTIGSPYSSVTATTEYDMIKVTLQLPFDAPNTIYYFSTNGAVGGSNSINLYEPSSFNIFVKNGVYNFNDISSPDISLYTGVNYTFVLLNSDQALFPFMIGSSVGTPYLGGVTNVQQGSYYTIFTVTITDPAITSLVYYCANNPAMFGVINIGVGPQSSRRLAPLAGDDDGFNLPFDQTCSGNYKVGDPRTVLRMSLYCSLARMETWIPASVQSKPYAIAPSCDKIARTFLTTQLYNPKNSPPYMFCGQNVTADTCTVQAPLNNIANRTCQEYCNGFEGMIKETIFIDCYYFLRSNLFSSKCHAIRYLLSSRKEMELHCSSTNRRDPNVHLYFKWTNPVDCSICSSSDCFKF